jgi:hypothetical protein
MYRQDMTDSDLTISTWITSASTQQVQVQQTRP